MEMSIREIRQQLPQLQTVLEKAQSTFFQGLLQKETALISEQILIQESGLQKTEA